MAVTFEIDYTAPRSRLTNFFRYFMAIPHLICVGVLSLVAQFVAMLQWFAILFTGKRNRGLWNFQVGVWNWHLRATAYATNMFDTYPNLGFDPGAEPVRANVEFEEQANRLTCALRILWAIPAIIVLMVVAVGWYVVIVLGWLAILFTGNQPRGLFDFAARALRLVARTTAYTSLLTDTYPKFE